jgi:hypothetical protein
VIPGGDNRPPMLGEWIEAPPTVRVWNRIKRATGSRATVKNEK